MSGRSKVATTLLWAVAVAITAALVRQRYHSALLGQIGGDLVNIIHAAQQVARGHSPYAESQFAYPPTFALAFAPFAHAGPEHLWKAWTALELGAVVVGLVAFTSQESSRLQPWQRPLLFVFCSITALHFWPLTIVLFRGQTETFVLAALMVSGYLSTRRRSVGYGAWLGVSWLLKGWPGAISVALLQRGLARRRDAILAFLSTLLLALILMVAFGGGSSVLKYLKNNSDARNQHGLVSDSVWGAPKLLFSHSGLARPLIVSSSLQVAVTAILLIWVMGLLVTALRTPGYTPMCLWNVTLCVVLLLPVSHLAYTFYALPILWLWASRVLSRAPKFEYREIAVIALLVVWWLVVSRSWPDTTSSAAISSVRFCIVFAANLIACTVSIVAEKALHHHTREPRTETAHETIDLIELAESQQRRPLRETSGPT